MESTFASKGAYFLTALMILIKIENATNNATSRENDWTILKQELKENASLLYSLHQHISNVDTDS